MFIVISQNDKYGCCQMFWIVVCNSEVTVLYANVYRWLGDMNWATD